MNEHKREQTKICVEVGDDPGLEGIVALVRLASAYESDISLETPFGVKADAKSVMQVFLYCHRHGNKATVYARGPDASSAIRALERYAKETTPRAPKPVVEQTIEPSPWV